MPINYTLKSSRKAKYLRIAVREPGVVVVTKPWLMPKFLVDRFVREKEDWVRKTIARIQKSGDRRQKNTIWYLGKEYRFQFEKGRVHLDFQTQTVVAMAYSEVAAKRSLVTFFKKQARERIIQSVHKHSQAMKLPHQSIRFKDQRTRWGSCSTKGNLNFNWRLIMGPPAVLEYVVIHELAHLMHMDHSAKFWDLVERYDPEYREHRTWLKRHEAELTRI